MVSLQEYFNERDWPRVGFGVGVQPFRWRLGHHVIMSSHWFHLGPVFIQWSLPRW